MKKISVILACPVVLNSVTFFRRFLYDSMLMFLISFIVFFVSLYVDFDADRNIRRRWNMFAAVMVYLSCILFFFNTEIMNRALLALSLIPAAAGIAWAHHAASASDVRNQSGIIGGIH